MERYTIYCDEEQTKKALELGAPIKQTEHQEDLVNVDYTIDVNVATILPTAEQMIGWLEEKGLHISVIYDDCTYSPKVRDMYDGFINNDEYLNSRKEATLAAIDAALDYLITNKN